jgi:hypothetical protein
VRRGRHTAELQIYSVELGQHIRECNTSMSQTAIFVDQHQKEERSEELLIEIESLASGKKYPPFLDAGLHHQICGRISPQTTARGRIHPAGRNRRTPASPGVLAATAPPLRRLERPSSPGAGFGSGKHPGLGFTSPQGSFVTREAFRIWVLNHKEASFEGKHSRDACLRGNPNP